MPIQGKNKGDKTDGKAEPIATDSSNGLDSIVEDIAENAPRVNETIVEALNKETETNGDTEPTENQPASGNESQTVFPRFSTDASDHPNGNVPFSTTGTQTSGFNPDIHCSNPDGTPRLTKNGNFRFKRGMKGAAPQSRPQAQSKSTQDYQASAGFCCDIFFSFNQSVFGPAWKPNSGEETNIRNAAARYWEANQFQDIPPGIALILAVGMYAVPRFNDEETQTRLRSIGEKLGIVKPKPVIVAESRVQSIPKPDSAFKPVDDEPPLQRNGYSTIYDRKPNG